VKNKGCLIAVLAAVLLVIGVGTVLYYSVVNSINPSYHGKRIYAWAEQAKHDPNPAARQEASQVLLEAFKADRTLRIQLTMAFCEGETLPKELIPFLVETLHAQEMPPGSYQSMALGRIEGEAAVPALVDVIDKDDEHARAAAVEAIRTMLLERDSKAAEAALHRVADGKDGEVQLRARDALKRYEEWNAVRSR
jgi:hypothetical protein